MLVGSKGGSVSRPRESQEPLTDFVRQPQETMAFSRCLVELGLASNAPAHLKTQVRKSVTFLRSSIDRV